MAYDSKRGRIMLFGGNVAQGKLTAESFRAGQRNDTWEFDGSAWTRVDANGPPARDHHALAYDEASGLTVLFGGFNGQYLGDTWIFHNRTWRQINAPGPPPRGGLPAFVYDSKRKSLLLFGGGI